MLINKQNRKMKKLFIYLVAGVSLCSSLTSCEDMLDEQTYGKPTSEELLSNEENMIMLVINIQS